MNRRALSFDEYQSARYFPALDGLRAVSCLFVITWHAEFLGWTGLNGYNGVTAFFVLSGYLITTLALREEAKCGKLNLRAFYVRRSFRIFPAYYAVLALYGVLIYLVESPSVAIERQNAFSLALPYYLFYLNEYASAPAMEQIGHLPPFIHSWSLGVEEKFYLIWPFLAFVILHRNTRGRVAVAVGIILVHYLLSHSTPVALLHLSKYTPILVGCILAILMEKEKHYRVLVRLASAPVHVVLLLALLAVQIGQSVDGPVFLYGAFPYLVALFMIGLVVGDTPCTRMLQSRFLVYLGLRTYGMYLLHLLAQNAVESALDPGPRVSLLASPFYFLLCVLVTAVSAEILFRLLESPCTNLGRRISRRIIGRSSPAAGAAGAAGAVGASGAAEAAKTVERAEEPEKIAGPGEAQAGGTIRPQLESET